MGPIEITFLSLALIFAVIGLVRGYTRELGVTIMLMLALFVIQFLETQASGPLNGLLTLTIGKSTSDQEIARALFWSAALIVVVFVSYQGETLAFPGNDSNKALGIGAGLLNGYLFAGSLWFFLGRANWPFLSVDAPYSELYRVAWRFLPPNLLHWPYLVALVAVMLILRVWK